MSVETWKSIADWATIVFIALTVVSGSAALILGDRINEKQTKQLRRFDEGLTAAKTELSAQQARAAEAEKQLQAVKQSTADAEVNVAEANRHAADANKKAGDATARAEAETIERLKLQAQIQPRDMSLVQRNELAIAVHRFHGSHVNVVSLSGDIEGWRLGQEIIFSLGSGGLVVTDSTNSLMLFGGRPAMGVQVSGPPEEREFMDALTEALHSQGGLEVLPPNVHAPPPDVADQLIRVQIMVGIKPIKMQ